MRRVPAWSVRLPLLGIITLVIMGVHGEYQWWLYFLVFISNIRYEEKRS